MQQWFLNNYSKNKEFKLQYNELLKSSYLTQRNLDDFKNPKYKTHITKLDIFKYITVLNYLFENNEHCLGYNLNPYLIDDNNNTKTLYPYNDRLEINMYKNIIIDLYFLDIPVRLIDLKIPLSVLFGLEKDNLGDLKELYKMGYGFDYFGKKSMSLFFMLYFKSFYKNITIFEYQDNYYHLSQILMEYSSNKLDELINSTKLGKEKYSLYSDFVSQFKDKVEYPSNDFKLESKIFEDILDDTSEVKQLHYETTGNVSPLDYQYLSNSYLSEYCLLYNFERSFNDLDDMIDEGIEVYLSDLLESNLNSKWFTSLIIKNKQNKIK